MSIYLGNTEIGQIYLGNTEISEAYLGSTKVFENNPTPPPYDAKIEYLRSTGMQYVKTNINGNARIIGCAQSSSINGSSTTLISSNNLGNSGCWYGEALSTTKWGVGGGEGNYSNVLSTTKATFDIDFGATEITGTVNAESISRTIQVNRSEWSIFASSTGGYAFSGKVFYIKIYKDNSLVRDFIPVRVGSTGYMYDKVSGQLFGNAGTGDFILGNDINT